MTTVASETAWAELRRGWPLVTACAIGFGLGLSGVPFYTFGVFVDPLRAAFGWSVGATQVGLTISYLTTMGVLPAVAWLADRYGVRRVALGSLTLHGLAFMSLGLTNGRLWTFYVAWFFISLFGTGTLAITWTRAVTDAFQAGRGLALGLSLLGTGIAGIFGPPLARTLIDVLGWRGAYACLGAMPIVIAVPITLLFFRDQGKDGRAPEKGMPARLSDPRLWILSVAFLAIAGGVAGVIPNLIKVFTTGGLSRADAVLAISVVGIFLVIGRVSCGALVDRFWAPGVATTFVLMPACACALLSFGHLKPQIAVLAAAMIGLAMGAEFDVLPFLVGRYIALERYTASLAAVSASLYLGASIGGPALAIFYDRLGSYSLGLCFEAALFAAGALTLLLLGPYPGSKPVGAPR